MRVMPSLQHATCASFLTTVLAAQHDGATLPIAAASDEAQRQIANFTLAPGLHCDLLAAEPDVCNAVAFAIDGHGRVYVAETFRIRDGVFDTRDYMQWKDDDLACLTVADRLAKYAKYLPDELLRFAAFPERIRLLVDSDGDGTLDRSTVFASGFNALADGVAAGVLPVGDDVFFTCIPKLWRLRDTDGDGVADEQHVVHDGYGAHTSLIGHDLHGLIVGPDRRLWFSIGDRGFSVQQGDRTLAYPHEGAVLRCELDGSDLEVVHRGLRNPQELAFDQWGDLFTGDNNSDGGDRARLVQVIPGADSGWRIGYQWLSDRGAWNREQMWQPRHPEQPAWILPPIANFADGPSGLAYDPGTGLPECYRDCFFLCDFRGGSSYSGVHALRLSRAGAGYELASSEHVIWGVLATDVDFAPDGSLYVLDWVDGWTKTGKGRIYRLRTEGMAPDEELQATARLLGCDLRQLDRDRLLELLGHADRRVRQQVQFILVDLGARDTLLAAANERSPRLARLHGIWGLGVLGRRDPTALGNLLPLLDDGDADVRAMTARVLGDARIATAVPALTKALADVHSRVRREAALALARIGPDAAAATPAVFDLLRANDDHDAVLRHAAVCALAAVASHDELAARLHDASHAVRLGVLLALARRDDAAIASFLRDDDASLRFEAARAIHGQPIAAALPALAQLCYDDAPDREATDWRAINANRLLGGVENGEALVHVATRGNHPCATRIEALRVLAEWRAPHGQDRVTGNWRPCHHETAENVVIAFAATVPDLLRDEAVAVATAEAAGQLQLLATAPALADLLADARRPDATRRAALDALAAMAAPQLEQYLGTIAADAPVSLRRRAVELLSRTNPERAAPVLASILDNGSIGERQAALQALGELPHPAADALLLAELDRFLHGDLPPALQLDLLEAAQQRDAAAIDERLAAAAALGTEGGALGGYLVCREGGDPAAGRMVFLDHAAANCTRCHSFAGKGGNAGPSLDHIGTALSHDQLLEALITPSARIAEGFGTMTIERDDGTRLTGVVTRERDGTLTIVDAAGTATEVPLVSIRTRTASSASAMPPMAGTLTRRQLRDVIAFLARQR
jgi:quinoprotein glucose dehydrogenase